MERERGETGGREREIGELGTEERGELRTGEREVGYGVHRERCELS